MSQVQTKVLMSRTAVAAARCASRCDQPTQKQSRESGHSESNTARTTTNNLRQLKAVKLSKVMYNCSQTSTINSAGQPVDAKGPLQGCTIPWSRSQQEAAFPKQLFARLPTTACCTYKPNTVQVAPQTFVHVATTKPCHPAHHALRSLARVGAKDFCTTHLILPSASHIRSCAIHGRDRRTA